MRKNFKNLRRRRKNLLIGSALLLAIGGTLLSRKLLTPGPTPRAEIAPGVFLSVQQSEEKGATGVTMIAEIHWGTPGSELVMRPFDLTPKTSEKSYDLVFPSSEVIRNEYVVLLNGALVSPAEWYRSYPGASVKPNESVVVNRDWSHLDPHSYLIWWDQQGTGHVETTKPPSPISQSNAVNGISVQALQIKDGRVNETTLRGHSESLEISRSFIGIDPERQVLWLIAFEKSTLRNAAMFTARQGARFGGQLDSGSATTMIVGPAAENVTPLMGIRNSRLLGSYIAIQRTQH